METLMYGGFYNILFLRFSGVIQLKGQLKHPGRVMGIFNLMVVES